MKTFMNMLTTWLMPQLEYDSADFVSWMEPHATITVMLGTSLTRHCHIDGLEGVRLSY